MWICGDVDMWICVYADMWICGYVDMWMRGVSYDSLNVKHIALHTFSSNYLARVTGWSMFVCLYACFCVGFYVSM